MHDERVEWEARDLEDVLRRELRGIHAGNTSRTAPGFIRAAG